MSERKLHGNISRTRNHEAELAAKIFIAAVIAFAVITIALQLWFGGK